MSTRTRRAVQSSSLKDSEQGDHPKSLQQRTDAMEAELRNINVPHKGNQQVEIPTLDDMTSYLLSNEVMDYLPSQQKAGYEIPPMNLRENEYDKSQTLSIKTREKNEPTFNQFNAEEGKKEIEKLFRMAQSLASNGDYQQAINYYNRIVGLNEKSGSAWIAMGHCYAMMGQDQKALNSYQQALKSAPLCQKDEQLWYGIGLLYQKFEDWNNAETAFRNALRLEPSPNMKGEVLYNLGMVMKAKGDFPEAIKVLTNAILSEAFSPEKIVEILCINGNMQEKMDDADGALQTYKYALMVQENNPKALACAGWLCFQLDLFEQALSYLTKAEIIMPNNGDIIYVIARCNLKMKQHTTAYDCLHKCLTKDPTNSIYWSSLGILFAELMQLKQAYDCLSKALRNDPKIPEHYFNLGCLFELSNQQKDALSMYDKALETSPNFQLALLRKRKILSDSQSTTLEVQFKHPPFVLPISQDLKKEKPLFNFANAIAVSLSPFAGSGSKGMTESVKSNGSRAVSSNERNSQANQNQERKLQINQRDLMAEQSILVKPTQLDLRENHKITLDNRSKNPKVPIGGLDDVNGLKINRPLISEPSATKLPSVQSLSSSISGLNSFSVVQNTFNNESKNQGNMESEDSNSLAPGRAKTEELLSMVKNLTPQDFAKQLNGLQAVIAKNSNLLQNLNVEGLKPIKNTSSPIVLKHNPQVLTLNESASAKKSVTQQNGENGAQKKTELKLTHKLNRSDDEEEVGVQKKIKTDNINKDEVIPSIGN